MHYVHTVGRCPTDMSLEDGYVRFTAGGDLVVYRCNAGFRLFGASVSSCQPDNKWSSPSPKCVGTTNIVWIYWVAHDFVCIQYYCTFSLVQIFMKHEFCLRIMCNVYYISVFVAAAKGYHQYAPHFWSLWKFTSHKHT